jgi:hypothetical protein
LPRGRGVFGFAENFPYTKERPEGLLPDQRRSAILKKVAFATFLKPAGGDSDVAAFCLPKLAFRAII